MATGGGWSYHLVNVVRHHKHPTELVFRQVYWARYIDWSLGTSLALIALTVLAGLPGAEILLALFADITMILFVHLHEKRLTVGSFCRSLAWKSEVGIFRYLCCDVSLRHVHFGSHVSTSCDFPKRDSGTLIHCCQSLCLRVLVNVSPCLGIGCYDSTYHCQF